MISHSDIGAMIAAITLKPDPQTLSHIAECLQAMHEETGALQAQVRKWKGFDEFKIGKRRRIK